MAVESIIFVSVNFYVIDQVAAGALTCATFFFSFFDETESFMIFLSVTDTGMTLTSAPFFQLLIEWILLDSFTKEQLEDRMMSLPTLYICDPETATSSTLLFYVSERTDPFIISSFNVCWRHDFCLRPPILCKIGRSDAFRNRSSMEFGGLTHVFAPYNVIDPAATWATFHVSIFFCVF